MKKQYAFMCAISLVFVMGAVFPVAAFHGSATSPPPVTDDADVQYLLLATKKTGTMQKEIREAAEAGYRFQYAMGGGTSFGGSEVVVVKTRPSDAPEGMAQYEYVLLATSKTSTMQKEMREAAESGYEYRDQTVFPTAFGGSEVLVIMERELDNFVPDQHDYLLLATKKTKTMQKELREAADQGYVLLGMTVSKTRFAGSELVCIMRRLKQ